MRWQQNTQMQCTQTSINIRPAIWSFLNLFITKRSYFACLSTTDGCRANSGQPWTGNHLRVLRHNCTHLYKKCLETAETILSTVQLHQSSKDCKMKAKNKNTYFTWLAPDSVNEESKEQFASSRFLSGSLNVSSKTIIQSRCSYRFLRDEWSRMLSSMLFNLHHKQIFIF